MEQAEESGRTNWTVLCTNLEAGKNQDAAWHLRILLQYPVVCLSLLVKIFYFMKSNELSIKEVKLLYVSTVKQKEILGLTFDLYKRRQFVRNTRRKCMSKLFRFFRPNEDEKTVL